MIGSILPDGEQFGMNYRHKTLGHNVDLDLNFHSHIEYEIFYFHSGRCRYFINNKIYDLRPGDLIVMHGLTLHKPNPDTNVPYERTRVHFKPEYLEKWVRSFSSINLFLPFEKLKNTKINVKNREKQWDRLFQQIKCCNQYRYEPLYGTRLRVLLLDLLTLVYEECAGQEAQHAMPVNSKVANTQKIIDYVERHFTEVELNLDKIAKEVFLSKYYVSRIFKEVTGTGVANYILIKKIDLARRLLLKGETVTEASFETGFKHPAHFSRVFKQKVGITANAFQRSNQDFQKTQISH